MEENRVTETGQLKLEITVKKILRVLSIMITIFYFCPTFLVSCSGQKVEISAWTVTKGISMYGSTVVKPHLIMLVCMLLPIAIFALLFLKKFTEKQTAAIICACSGIDLIIWLVFRATVKKYVEESYCSFKTTGWYVINVILLILIIGIAVLILLGKINMDLDLKAVLTSKEIKDALNQVSANVSQMSSTVSQIAGNVANNIESKNVKNAIGYCAKCGKPITYGSKFCISCGTPVPQSMIDEAEAAKRAKEQEESEDKAEA